MKQLINAITHFFTFFILISNLVNAQILTLGEETKILGLEEILAKNHFESSPKFKLSGITIKANKHQLDSVITFQYNKSANNFFKKNKDEIKYDSIGRTILFRNYFFNDSSGNWQLTSGFNSRYEAWGYQTSLERYDNWNDAFGKYGSASKSEYSYDNLGNQIEANLYIWNYDSQTFRINEKRKFSYILNSKGAPIRKIDSVWNFITDKFELKSKTEFSYNQFLNISQYINYEYDGTNWTPAIKIEFIYDSLNNMLLRTTSIFRDNLWVMQHKNEYTYDAKGNNDSEKAFLWNSQSNEWDGNFKVNYVFDNNGNKTLINTFYWNITQKLWVNQSKMEFNFENNGNISTYILSTWNENSNQWVNSYKDKYNYNNNYSYEDLICNYSNELFKHMLTDFSSEKWINNGWEIENRSNYYYSSDLINGIIENGKISSEIFPNPTSGLVNITTEQIINKVQVFDYSGILVHTQNNINKENKITLDLSSFNNGIYLVQIENEDGRKCINKIMVYK